MNRNTARWVGDTHDKLNSNENSFFSNENPPDQLPSRLHPAPGGPTGLPSLSRLPASPPDRSLASLPARIIQNLSDLDVLLTLAMDLWALHSAGHSVAANVLMSAQISTAWRWSWYGNEGLIKGQQLGSYLLA